MRTFETEKHNIPEGATHYRNECDAYHFSFVRIEAGDMFLWCDTYWDCTDDSYFKEGIKPISQRAEIDERQEFKMMINCKEDLYGTYIENDNGELRNLYLSKCQEFGLNINSACYVTRSALIFAKEDFGSFGNVDHAEVLDFITSKLGITKELTLSDLKSEPEIEWRNGDKCLSSTGYTFTFIGLCNYSRFDCILLSDSGVLTFGFTKDLLKPESPEEKKKREREENAIAYFNFETQCFREAGENDQLLTDSWEKANSIAKEAYRIMAEKLNFKAE